MFVYTWCDFTIYCLIIITISEIIIKFKELRLFSNMFVRINNRITKTDFIYTAVFTLSRNLIVVLLFLFEKSDRKQMNFACTSRKSKLFLYSIM